MYEMLQKGEGRLSLHMPGHKNKPLFGMTYPSDTTELFWTDDLFAPANGIKQAECLMAQSAKAGESLFLCGGSTAGNQIALFTFLKPGETVILPRNAHLSAVNACILGDFLPVFVELSVRENDYVFVSEASFINAIDANPDAKVVFVTRPDFYGGMIGLQNVVNHAHARGMKVVVDEAHGAHFNWYSEIACAAKCGADAWIQSAHKTLPAINAAAMLHLKKREDAVLARRMARLMQSSSPSFSVLQSIDDAREYMDIYGAAKLNSLIEKVDVFCRRAQTLGYKDARREDRTRLVLQAPQGGKTLAHALAQMGIDVEMYDRQHIVCILTVMDDQQTFDRLLKALETIPSPMETGFDTLRLPNRGERRLRVREAALKENEAVPVDEVENRISAVCFGLYPPGIPLCSPGEVITADLIDVLMNQPGLSAFGIENNAIPCVKEK